MNNPSLPDCYRKKVIMHPTHLAPASPRTRFPVLAPLVALLFALGMAACGVPQNPQEQEETAAESDTFDTVAEVLAGDDRFATLVTALDSAGLTQTLREEGPYTVFAPTDAAFVALPSGTVDDLLLPEYRDRLTAILTYHVAESTHAASDLQRTSSLPMLDGHDLPIAIENNAVRVDEATIIDPDLDAGNGIVHVIDAVLLPPEDDSTM